MPHQSNTDSEPRSSRPTGVRLVHLYGAVLLTAAVMIWAFLLRDLESLPGPIEIRWWWLVPAFAVTEILVVHLDFNRQAQTLSLSEIPLIFALFFAAPGELVAAQALGVGLTLMLYRRQSAMKVIFNLGQTAIVAIVAVAVFRALLPSGIAFGWGSWLAALTATITADIVAGILVSSAIGLLDRWTMPSLASFLGLGMVATIANTALGLLGIELVNNDPGSVMLLVVPVVVTFMVYNAFWRQRRRSQHFEFLYESMRRLSRALGPDEAVAQLLREAKDMFSAEISGFVLFPTVRDEPARRSVLDGDNRFELFVPVPVIVDGPTLDGHESLLWEVQYGRPRRHLEILGRTVRDAIAIQLRGDSGSIGVIVVADRIGEVNTFTQADMKFLETFGTHAAVALENRYLERSVGELSDVNTELTHRALHDPLTHLANRVLFRDRLDHALSVRDPDDTYVGLLFIDLDDFKAINDTHGHEAGDQVLVAVAERIRACLRPSDTAARLGGDEFTILLESVQGQDEIDAVSTRILQALEVPIAVGEIEIQANASIGQTISRRVPGSATELMAQADSAMYVAKSHGKGQWAAADSPPG